MSKARGTKTLGNTWGRSSAVWRAKVNVALSTLLILLTSMREMKHWLVGPKHSFHWDVGQSSDPDVISHIALTNISTLLICAHNQILFPCIVVCDSKDRLCLARRVRSCSTKTSWVRKDVRGTVFLQGTWFDQVSLPVSRPGVNVNEGQCSAQSCQNLNQLANSKERARAPRRRNARMRRCVHGECDGVCLLREIRRLSRLRTL